MRTLLLSTSFCPVHGGIETYLHELAKALCDYNITVCVPATEGHEIFDANTSLNIVRYNGDSKGLGYWDAICLCRKIFPNSYRFTDKRASYRRGRFLVPMAALLSSRSVLRKLAMQSQLFADNPSLLSTDLIQAGSALPSGIAAWLIHHSLGTPYVVYTHGMEILLWGSRRKTRPLLTTVLSDAARVGVVSRFTARLVQELGIPEHRIRLVPPGIETESFSQPQDVQVIRQRYALSTKNIILTHGRLDPRKGHDMVIRALPAVISAHPDTTYLITGTGPNEAILKGLARELRVEDHVRFGGRVPSELIAGLYQVCDVFVMATRQIGQSVEGFGIVCLEAAAVGRPVLAGRSGGIADAVEDGITGYLVNPEDPGEIAARLIQLLSDDSLRDKLGTAGRRRVERHFNTGAFRRRIKSFIGEVVQINSGDDKST